MHSTSVVAHVAIITCRPIGAFPGGKVPAGIVQVEPVEHVETAKTPRVALYTSGFIWLHMILYTFDMFYLARLALHTWQVCLNQCGIWWPSYTFAIPLMALEQPPTEAVVE